jgi:hypothetical protein
MSSIRYPTSQMTAVVAAGHATDTSTLTIGGMPSMALNGTYNPVAGYGANVSINMLPAIKLGSYTTMRTSLRLFKGAIPTTADLDAATILSVAGGINANATDITLRTTDQLVRIPLTANTASIDANGNLLVSTDIGLVSATGTATWFLLTVSPAQVSGSGSAQGETFYHNFIAGTVTVTGGGGELQADIVTFTAGQNVRVFSSQISIPLPLNIE